jgi:FkbM family methyltransferase
VISEEVPWYGVEPNHACTLYLQELIRLNAFNQAHVLPFAFSDREGLANIYAGGFGSKRGSALRSHRTDADLPFTFEAWFTPGDRVVESLGLDRIAVIKVDVEEAELETLTGLERTLRRTMPYIHCEILKTGEDPDRRRRAEEICRLVRGLGYEIVGVREEDRVLEVVREDERVGQDFWEEYVFAPPDLVGAFMDAVRTNRSGVVVR